jgi:hypothetical protein
MSRIIPLIITAVVALLVLCPLAHAGDWIGIGLGSDDLVTGRALYDSGGRAKVGGELSWMDGIGAGEVEGWRVAFVGAYDVLQDVPLKVPYLPEVSSTWYIGGLAGVLFPESASADATAALMTGFTIGGERASIGIEYQYALTDDLWGELAEIPDKHRVMFTASFKF